VLPSVPDLDAEIVASELMSSDAELLTGFLGEWVFASEYVLSS
jgi:hypothetical protein